MFLIIYSISAPIIVICAVIEVFLLIRTICQLFCDKSGKEISSFTKASHLLCYTCCIGLSFCDIIHLRMVQIAISTDNPNPNSKLLYYSIWKRLVAKASSLDILLFCLQYFSEKFILHLWTQ
eukprot:132826_1